MERSTNDDDDDGEPTSIFSSKRIVKGLVGIWNKKNYGLGERGRDRKMIREGICFVFERPVHSLSMWLRLVVPECLVKSYQSYQDWDRLVWFCLVSSLSIEPWNLGECFQRNL